MGYEDAPEVLRLEEGVYYNKYMSGNKIKMAEPIVDGIIEYTDGTEATKAQISKDVTTFLVWAENLILRRDTKLVLKQSFI